MGIFDGILLASDWDGTLCFNGELNPKDIESIKYFCREGGLFTLSSGRSLHYMRQFFEHIKPNTYAITLNGAVIAHPDNGDILYQGVLNRDISATIYNLMIENALFHTVYVYYENEGEAIFYDSAIFPSAGERIKSGRLHKAVFVTDSPLKVRKAKELIKLREDTDGLIFVGSWDTSLEVLAEDNAKGYAIKRLAEKLGAKLTVAVGDYENDSQMIEMADIGYAVGNASESLKAIADRITVHAKDGALSHIIADLENDIKSKAPKYNT